MAKRYFNWKLAIVLVIGIVVLGITAIGMHRWQRSSRIERELILGNKAYNEHRWEEAARNLGYCITVEKDDVTVLLKYADAQLKIRPLKQNNVQQAIATYRTILRTDKNNAEAAKQLIDIYLHIGMPSEAGLVAKRFLDTNQSPELRRMLAVALAKQRKFREATTELKAIIAEHPEQILVYETLGQFTQQRPEDFPGSPSHWFNEAVKNNPSSALAYIVRAGFYLRNMDKPNALADLEQAEKQDLSDLVVRLRLAREFVNADVLDKAEEHLAAVQIAEPASQDLWQMWAQLALKSQSKEKTRKVAEAGLKELSSQPWDFMPIATELFILCGQLDRAADCISELRQQDITPAHVAFLEGFLANEKGRFYEAIKCFHKAMELGDSSPRVQLALALALAHVGDTQSAIRQLRNLVSEWPNFFDVHLALARMLAQDGNWPEAAEQARIATQISPDSLNVALLYLQARIQILATHSIDKDIQSWQGVEKQLSTLDKTTNGAPEVKLVQLRLAMQRGNFDDANEFIAQLKKDSDLQRIQKEHPWQLRIAMAEVELFVAEGKKDEAMSVLNETIKEFPQAVEPVRYLAILLDQQDNHEKCEAVIKDALVRIKQPLAQRELGLLLARIYTQWGKGDDAYKFLNTLARKLPNDIPIKRQFLTCKQIIKNVEKAQQIVNDIKALEGEDGWQWRYEQARVWFGADDFKYQYPQIIALLQENLLANPDDQLSRMLLAAAYERAGRLQLAISTYRDALSRSPEDLRIIIPTVAALYRAEEYDQAEDILNYASREKLYHPQLQKLQLQSYLRRGQLSSASDILQGFLITDPNNQTAVLSLALLNMQQNKFAEADELLAKLKIQDPNSLPVTAAQIQLNIYQSRPKEALRLCEEIVNNLKNASAYILRARTFASLGQTDKAIEDLEHATTTEPNNVGAWVAKCEFYRSVKQLDKAITSIQKAMSIFPDNLAIQKRAISLFLTSGSRDIVREGKDILDKALTSKPEDIELRLYKARSLLAEGTAPAIEQATGILQGIAEDQPKLADAWALLAEISLRQGQTTKAMDIALRGLAHCPNEDFLLLLKARSEAAISPTLAIPTLRVLHEVEPNDVGIALRLADTYIAANESEKAMNLLRKQLGICDASTRRRCNIALAIALYKSGDKDEAEKLFCLLFEAAPDDPTILLAQSRLLKDDQLWGQLNQKVIDWYQKHPEDSHPLITIARDLGSTENSQAKKTAEDLLRRVLECDPNSILAMKTLAMLLQLTGRYAESAELYQQVLMLEPDNLIAINNLAWIMSEEQSKFRQALDLAQRGLEIAPQYIDLIDTRGVVHYRLGVYDKAIRDFKRCIELYPTGISSVVASYFHLGRALADLGQKDEAIENLKKALDLNTKIGGLSAADVVETQRLLQEQSEKG